MTSIGWRFAPSSGGGFDAQVLDRLGRRLAGLGAEGTAELART